MNRNRAGTAEVIRVSKGCGEESYTLKVATYFPFGGDFPEVDKLEEGNELEVGLGKHIAYISKSEHFYLIRVPGFGSKEKANDFLKMIQAGLLAFTLKQKVSLSVADLQPVDTNENTRVFREQNKPEMYGDWLPREDGNITDGAVFPHFTAIIPEHLRIVEYAPPIYFERKGYIYDSKLLIESFNDININYDIEGIMNNERLMSALEVFSSAYAQIYRPLTYLNLVIVLEILAGNESPASDFIIRIVERFVKIIKKLRVIVKPKDREKYEQLNDLLNGINRLKKLSIASELRKYVYNVVYRGDPNFNEKESNSLVNLIYGVRSNLAHRGTVSHEKDTYPQQTYSDTFEFLQRIVPQALLHEMNKYLKNGSKSLRIF